MHKQNKEWGCWSIGGEHELGGGGEDWRGGEQERLEKGLHEGGQLDVPEAESPTVVGSQGHLHLKVHTDPTIYCWLNKKVMMMDF